MSVEEKYHCNYALAWQQAMGENTVSQPQFVSAEDRHIGVDAVDAVTAHAEQSQFQHALDSYKVDVDLVLLGLYYKYRLY